MAPIDPLSASIVANASKQVEEFGVGFSFADFSVSIFYAAPDTPMQKVTVDHREPSGAVAKGLAKMFAEVPIPPQARPVGPWFGDNHMVIYSPTLDTLWEGWRWSQFEVDGPHTDSEAGSLPEEVTHAPGWHVEEGACIQGVSKNPGYFTETSFPGVSASHAYSARASGLLLPGGVVTPAEAQRGYIDHALALSFIGKELIFNEPRWPAMRTDGESTDPTMPWEGMCFRLPPSYDTDKIEDRFARMLSVALRDFGGYVCDGSNSVSFKLASEATKRNEHGYTTDAWKGPEGKFGESHGAILNGNSSVAKQVPWADLQVVDSAYRPSSLAPGRARGL